MRELGKRWPEMGSRGDSAGITAVGLAALIAYAWFPYLWLLIAGAIVALIGAAGLVGDLRRGREWHRQDVMLRKLWRAVKGIPPGCVLADQECGELLAAERDRSWLTLAVTELAPPDSTTTVARYALGRWAAPDRPPLYRHLGALDDPPPSRWRWRQQAALAEFNARTGAMAVSTEELAALLAQVTRAEVVNL